MLTACGGPTVAPSAPASGPPAELASKALPLPGATGPVSLDYLAYEAGRSRVWVPVGTNGTVAVLDTASLAFARVEGFETAEREVRGKKRTMGPSSATDGGAFVYVGNRATSEVCPVDVATLKAGACVKLAVPIDGVAYVASTKEVWVTTPRDKSLQVLDASKPGVLAAKAVVKLDGEPEGYAVDEAHGLFFTNLEDKGGTLAIDVAKRAVVATWSAGCGSDGPRGLAFDAAHGYLVVACTDHVQVLDAGHGGAPLGKLDTGAGVDNLDFHAGKRLLYAAAGKAARLTVARLDDKGGLTVVATAKTSEGARNAVVDAAGKAYVADSAGARVLVVDAP